MTTTSEPRGNDRFMMMSDNNGNNDRPERRSSPRTTRPYGNQNQRVDDDEDIDSQHHPYSSLINTNQGRTKSPSPVSSDGSEVDRDFHKTYNDLGAPSGDGECLDIVDDANPNSHIAVEEDGILGATGGSSGYYGDSEMRHTQSDSNRSGPYHRGHGSSRQEKSRGRDNCADSGIYTFKEPTDRRSALHDQPCEEDPVDAGNRSPRPDDRHTDSDQWYRKDERENLDKQQKHVYKVQQKKWLALNKSVVKDRQDLDTEGAKLDSHMTEAIRLLKVKRAEVDKRALAGKRQWEGINGKPTGKVDPTTPKPLAHSTRYDYTKTPPSPQLDPRTPMTYTRTKIQKKPRTRVKGTSDEQRHQDTLHQTVLKHAQELADQKEETQETVRRIRREEKEKSQKLIKKIQDAYLENDKLAELSSDEPDPDPGPSDSDDPPSEASHHHGSRTGPSNRKHQGHPDSSGGAIPKRDTGKGSAPKRQRPPRRRHTGSETEVPIVTETYPPDSPDQAGSSQTEGVTQTLAAAIKMMADLMVKFDLKIQGQQETRSDGARMTVPLFFRGDQGEVATSWFMVFEKTTGAAKGLNIDNDAELKIGHLLRYTGPNVHRIWNSMTEVDRFNYQKVKDLINKTWSLVRARTYAKKVFETRIQGPDETFQLFMADLIRLVKMGWGDDRVIADHEKICTQYFKGLKDKKVRDRLQMMFQTHPLQDITPDEIVMFSENADGSMGKALSLEEEAVKQRGERHPYTPRQYTPNNQVVPYRQGQAQQRMNQSPNRIAEYPRNPSQWATLCWSCGQSGHQMKDCKDQFLTSSSQHIHVLTEIYGPNMVDQACHTAGIDLCSTSDDVMAVNQLMFPDITCFKCGEKGHYAYDCIAENADPIKGAQARAAANRARAPGRPGALDYPVRNSPNILEPLVFQMKKMNESQEVTNKTLTTLVEHMVRAPTPHQTPMLMEGPWMSAPRMQTQRLPEARALQPAIMPAQYVEPQRQILPPQREYYAAAQPQARVNQQPPRYQQQPPREPQRTPPARPQPNYPAAAQPYPQGRQDQQRRQDQQPFPRPGNHPRRGEQPQQMNLPLTGVLQHVLPPPGYVSTLNSEGYVCMVPRVNILSEADCQVPMTDRGEDIIYQDEECFDPRSHSPLN